MSKHFTNKNTLGGSFCNKCLEWSSEPDGLDGEECFATKEEADKNRRLLKYNSGKLIVIEK